MIYLASNSPRRRALLEQIGVSYQQFAVEIDETMVNNESPQNYVKRLALEKAQSSYTALLNNPTSPQNIAVLGADTIVVFHQRLFGKPTDLAMAYSMLKQLSGNSHQVMTAVALVTSQQEQVRLNLSTVYFRSMSDTEIRSYIATSEPFDKAGSYAIQGLASVFIERIEGSYSGIMGLPLYETATLLMELGLFSIGQNYETKL
ncbi:MAG: hypothetical protein BWK79_01585 [Beggiatoa sp. IS2]|nr:MAG: hypothetical protein BWK79_01585 [Beggiatoa sp. IS2]